MAVIILILLLVAVIWVAFVLIRGHLYVKRISQCNAIVFGGKGKGKDMLFHKIATIASKKHKVVSNIDYGYNHEDIDFTKMSLGANTYSNMIDNNIIKCEKYAPYENACWLVSDAGIYFSNIFDKELKKKYPSLPLFVAVVRHTYNGNVIFNTQDIGRIWQILEEQQTDCFVEAIRTIKIFGWIFSTAIYYDNFESARQHLRPIKKTGLHNETNRANVVEYYADHGKIRQFTYVTRVRKIKYDTRHFHRVFFGQSFQDWKDKYTVKPLRVKKVKIENGGKK